jgi:hypothetical protein
MEDEDADLGELEDDTIEDEELDSDVTFENALQELEGLLDGL